MTTADSHTPAIACVPLFGLYCHRSGYRKDRRAHAHATCHATRAIIDHVIAPSNQTLTGSANTTD